MRIAIIGAGASGLAAAIETSKVPTNETVIFEKQSRVGKKLSATGNGRCNLSNVRATERGYHGDEADFAKFALSEFSVESTLAWFKGLGLYTVTDRDGKIYPYSEQANSVVDVLRFAIQKDNIKLVTDKEIKSIKKSGDGFIVDGDFYNRVIISCGGLASSKLGGTLAGYRLLNSLGHSTTKLRPSLVQIKTVWGGISALKGVRANCKAQIYRDGKLTAESEGEIQFTDYGISGPVIFEVSRDVCTGGKWECKLDFLPAIEEASLKNELIRRKSTPLLTDDLFTGIIHNKLGRVITKECYIKNGIRIKDIDTRLLEKAAKLVKCFVLELKEPMGMDNAQVTAGGVRTSEFEATTMESKLCRGLYACGEVLDIDGDCGGYNLQWAWSSGRLAGVNAGKER